MTDAPMFTPFTLRGMTLKNRLAMSPDVPVLGGRRHRE